MLRNSNRATRHQRASTFYWAFATTFLFGVLLFFIELSNPFSNFSALEWLVFTLAAILVIIFLNFVFGIWRSLRIQKIRHQPSWVYYFSIVILIGPLWSTLFFILISVLLSTVTLDSYIIRAIFFNIIFSIFFYIFLLLIRKSKYSENLRFASGSVGAEEDKLEFKESAANIAHGLQRLNRYVNVIGLYGGLGFGKSSYARMIVENLDQDKTLYTYISLTETNEARDFSKLFAERWFETLKLRYPKIDTVLALPFMQAVLRESGNGVLASIMSIISGLNKGLVETRAVTFDEYYKPKEKKSTVSSSVAGLFGNVPEFHEDFWVIMVDELDRAHFEETYRVIEVIERFKNEGRTGLPIKLIFILCISTPEFKSHLDIFKESDQRAALIDQFLHDGKSITQIIFIPPTSEKMGEYILEKIKQFKTELDLNLDRVIEEAYPDTFPDTTREFIQDHVKALSYIMGKLQINSARVVSRCFQGLFLFYSSFRDRSGKLQKPPIRFSDLLAMEYVKIKYPHLILFFERTIGLLLASYNEAGRGMTRAGFNSYLIKDKLKERKISLADWVSEVTGITIPDSQKKEIEDIIGLISYSYLDYLNVDSNTKNADLYYDSLSLPKNLYDYLSVVSDSVETSFDYYNQIYRKHQDGKLDFKTLDLSDIVGYAKFVTDIPRSSISINVELLSDLARRITEKEVEVTPKNTGDTIYDSVIYQFVFQIVAVAERDRESKDQIPSDNLSVAFRDLKKVLESPDVITGGKFIILNSLANNTRGSGSDIHFRLENTFSRLQKYWSSDLLNLIRHVFEEANQKYNIDQKVIYDNEENFFYTMYQGWSGRADAADEIKNIRMVARRGLEKHPDAIGLYWRRYKFNKQWTDFSDVLRDDPFFGHDANHELYMPLTTLVEVTKLASINDEEVSKKLAFWGAAMEDQKYKDFAKLKDDKTTLKAVLVARQLLVDNLSITKHSSNNQAK